MTERRRISSSQILDAALRVARDRHWETVRLVDIADTLGISLADIQRHFADKEALIDALWDRADAALLKKTADPALAALTVPQQLEALVFAWLEPLAAYRKTVREMLLVRLEPGHLHIQVPTLLRVSKTVQWMREGARLRAAFAWRALEETALTSLFLATVTLWLRDGHEEDARRLLQKGLATAHALRTQIGPRNEDRDRT